MTDELPKPPDPPVIPGWRRFAPVLVHNHPEGVLIWKYESPDGRRREYPYIKDDSDQGSHQ